MYNAPYVSEEHMLYLDKLSKYYKRFNMGDLSFIYYDQLYSIYSSYSRVFPIELNLVKWIDLTIESILSYIEYNNNEFKLDAIHYIEQIEDIINQIDDSNIMKKRLKILLPAWLEILNK